MTGRRQTEMTDMPFQRHSTQCWVCVHVRAHVCVYWALAHTGVDTEPKYTVLLCNPATVPPCVRALCMCSLAFGPVTIYTHSPSF